MTTSQHAAQTLDSIGNTRDVLSQAENEGRALRGEFGVARQLVAMSAQYLALKAAGQLDAAAAVKAEAMSIRNAAAQQEA
jgi:hypothetical protein